MREIRSLCVAPHGVCCEGRVGSGESMGLGVEFGGGLWGDTGVVTVVVVVVGVGAQAGLEWVGFCVFFCLYTQRPGGNE